MPPSLQSKREAKDKLKMDLCPLPNPRPLLLPVSEADVDQLWSQYCSISNMSQRTRRSQTTNSSHMNYWAGTYEVDRYIHIDVLIRNSNIRVRLSGDDMEASRMPVYLPNMAVPLEFMPQALFDDIDKLVTMEVYDATGCHLGNCELTITWRHGQTEPTLLTKFKHRIQVSPSVQNSGNNLRMKVSENETFKSQGGSSRSFEVMLF